MDRIVGWFFGTLVAWIILGVIVFFSIWAPLIAPWKQDRLGAANLAQAQQERRILVEQAEAEKDAAQLRADAIAIVGAAAKEFPEYRQQEFIGAFAEALQQGKIGQIIYVPTEANIPIMEAGQR